MYVLPTPDYGNSEITIEAPKTSSALTKRKKGSPYSFIDFILS